LLGPAGGNTAQSRSPGTFSVACSVTYHGFYK
jgi:hypothetical protein